MTERTVAELRADAATVLELVELDAVNLIRSNFDAVSRRGEFTIVTAFSITTKFERFDNLLRSWVRHRVLALIDPGDYVFPDDPDDISEDVIAEHLAWRAESEWTAEYLPRGEQTLSDLDSSACSAFAMVLGPPTIHPYAREHFQSLVAKGPYPAFTLPHIAPISSFADDEVMRIDDA